MTYPPCINPSCKSYGSSHPNCQCYGGEAENNPTFNQAMAEGGDVHFCSQDRAHQRGCEYYADGGNVGGAAQDAPPAYNETQPVAVQPDTATVKQEAAPAYEETSPAPATDLGVAPDQEPPPAYDDTTSIDGSFGTPTQQTIAGLEGAAEGFAGPLATLAETKLLGVNPEDIAYRAQANPITHAAAEAAGIGAGLYTGVGEAGLLAHGLEAIPLLNRMSVLSKLGGTVIKGAILNGAIQGGDEISQAMLGQGDPQAPVASALAHIGGAALLGGGIAGVGGVASASLKALGEAKAGTKIQSFLMGMGKASQNPGVMTDAMPSQPGFVDGNAWRQGERAFNKLLPKVIQKGTDLVSEGIGSVIGNYIGGFPGTVVGYKAAEKYLAPTLETLIGRPITTVAQKYVFPTLLKVMSSDDGINGFWGALDHASDVSKGAQKITKGVSSLFQTGSQQAVAAYASEKDRQKIKDYVESGALNNQIKAQLQQQPVPSQSYAEGGEVRATPAAASTPLLQGTEGLSQHYPDQATLMSAAKGRVNEYLNGIRPQPSPTKLAYDVEPNKDAAQKVYDHAVTIAAAPLSVLNNVKDGTLTPDHMKHLNGMYPELYQHLSKQITSHIMQQQMDGERPAYHMRQTLSMFLGAPLDSTLVPANMVAAQSVYMQQKQQAPQPGVKNKKGTATLTKASEQYQTTTQASEARQKE